jgi:hypothetical protein
MADFTALTVDTGVGAYHFNRFRIAFQLPPGKSAAFLASDLVVRFPSYLNSPYATVEWGDHYHEGKPTLRFHGIKKLLGINIAAPHSDWVVREWVDQMVGFTAQTLKREFFSAGEDIAAFEGPNVGASVLIPVVGPVYGAAGGFTAAHYNRMHFLAGRRSWRISPGNVFGVQGNVIVLETIAAERFSAHAYNIGDAVIGLEKAIPDVWIALLNNFVTQNGFTVVPQPLGPRWVSRNRVDYLQLAFPSLGAMKADAEFAKANALYPTILPP